MKVDHRIYVQVAHEQAIVSAGVVALLDRRDEMIASIASFADTEFSMGDRGTTRRDVLIADRTTALEFCSIRRTKRGTHLRSTKILALTHLDREWDLRGAMEAGVHGYLLQGCTVEQLVSAVRAVCAGSKYVPCELAPRLADCLLRDNLTTREMEVLRVMSTGASNRAISIALGIADATVKAHVRAILGKVGAGARTEAVAIASQRGLTSPPSAQGTLPTTPRWGPRLNQL